ncbi:MAG: ribonuclease D [Gammaproteobacteria bacterium]
MSFEHITSNEQLVTLCQRLRGASVLALDTEFIREKTYYPKLCLIQIATPECVACIDPLSISQMQPLWDLLLNPDCLKVLHAARQDLEIFYHLFGEVPQPVFDTQLVATVLGYGEQVGYGNLIKKVLDVDLNKGHARTDWMQRPLSQEQLDYAADDVRYLIQAYPVLVATLEKLKRSDWLKEDFNELVQSALYDVELDQVWQRVSGTTRLKGVQLAILQQLAAWREQEAKTRDKPRKWILADDMLVSLAQHPPRDKAQLQRLRGLSDNLIHRHGDELLRLIKAGQAVPREQWPSLKFKSRLSVEQEALADSVMALIRLRATQNQITATLLATRKDVDGLIQGDPTVSLLHGWRAALAGQDVLAYLEGKLVLQVEDRQLVAQPVTP